MKYWATRLSRADILKIFEEYNVGHNSFCLLHHKDGETIISGQDSYNDSVIEKSGEFYVKEMDSNDWLNFQTEMRFTVTGDPYLAPFKMVPSNSSR